MWGLLLIAAILWPARSAGPLHGAPLDTPVAVLLFGAALGLWFVAPAFLKTRGARLLVGGLAVWKAAGWLLLTQTGLCAAFFAAPQAGAARQLQPSWDARTLWSPALGCTAIMTRPYREFEEFPAWTVNVLPDDVRPPAGSFALDVHGIVEASRTGDVTFDTSADSVDAPLHVESDHESRLQTHAELHGVHWWFVPRLDGGNLFDVARTFVSPPTRLDRFVSGWGQWVSPVLLVLLLGMWAAFAVRSSPLTTEVYLWTIAMAAAAFALGAFVEPPRVRFTMLLVFAAAAVPVPQRLRMLRTAFLMVALPWLAFYAGRSLHDVGRFVVYTNGDDWWTFQRHAFRIFMQGFWFEGGEQTFWNQPLYRWTAGALHVIFGDSSVGEMYLDAIGIAVGAMFAFDSVSRLAGFRFGVLAAAVVLNVTMLGPNWYGVGRGLSEISAAMFVYLAAFALRKSRQQWWPTAAIAGACAALAFFTRLNHLVLLLVIVVLLLPDSLDAGSLVRVRQLWQRLPKRHAVAYLACIAGAVLAIATRTWYYTGRFSLFLGTQRDLVSTGLGASTLGSRAAWARALESVSMIATVQDPPRLDVRVIAVTAGVVCAILGLLRAPLLRRLPLSLSVFCVGAIAGGLFVRGSAYAGRFSVQLVPVAIAVAIGALGLAVGGQDQPVSSGSPSALG